MAALLTDSPHFADGAAQTELSLHPLRARQLRPDGWKGFCPTCSQPAAPGPSAPAGDGAPIAASLGVMGAQALRAQGLLESQPRVRAAAEGERAVPWIATRTIRQTRGPGSVHGITNHAPMPT